MLDNIILLLIYIIIIIIVQTIIYNIYVYMNSKQIDSIIRYNSEPLHTCKNTSKFQLVLIQPVIDNFFWNLNDKGLQIERQVQMDFFQQNHLIYCITYLQFQYIQNYDVLDQQSRQSIINMQEISVQIYIHTIQQFFWYHLITCNYYLSIYIPFHNMQLLPIYINAMQYKHHQEKKKSQETHFYAMKFKSTNKKLTHPPKQESFCSLTTKRKQQQCDIQRKIE
eukprot:TRINITY_DN8402_c0_g1_i6.p1 TRINITY_DN8402_c0_g1~~TRINITY_DN8402_c0_g1_i6.p1  ORF type:complete len:223 (+),score=-20.23 TRINITY_DN8402_c0_g1_i6:254-922(+)